MPLPKSLTTVTPLSKVLAAVLFITFPFLGFYLGMQYERELHPQGTNQPSLYKEIYCKKWETVCDPNSPNDANLGCAPMKICVDPSSSIQPDTIPTPTTYEGMFCGGIAGKKCPLGYTCQITDRNPDASGKCVSAEYNTKPDCTPHVPIGGTGSIPSNDIYPTLPPGGRWCPDSFNEMPPKSWDDSICTQDAQQCPDGSYVSRQGPNCEFSKCPGE